MHKRQDAAKTNPHKALWLLLVVIVVFISACQQQPTLEITVSTEMITQTNNPTPVQSTSTAAFSQTPSQTPSPKPSLSPTFDCMSAGGIVQNAVFHSEHLGKDFPYQVYLPPCYQPDSDPGYPSLYLLHGLLYTNEQWLRLGLQSEMDALIASQEIAPFIVILPQETDFIPPQASNFPDALVLDLIPWIDEHYNTADDRQFRAIGGLSRGAAWAIRIGFSNSRFFGSIGAHSLPLFEADGGRVSGWVSQTVTSELPEVFIDIGRQDQERQTAQAFADILDKNNIPHTWYLFNGGHTEAYWSSHLALYLTWYARNW